MGVSQIHKEKKAYGGCVRPSHIRSRHTTLGGLLVALGEVPELILCVMCPVGHISLVRLLGLAMVAETATRNRSRAMAEACGYYPVDGAFRSYFSTYLALSLCGFPATPVDWIFVVLAHLVNILYRLHKEHLCPEPLLDLMVLRCRHKEVH